MPKNIMQMQKINYQQLTDEIIARETERYAADGRRAKILLHACCAPCASYVVPYLAEHFDVDVYFYNPNIAPREEYEHRLAELYRLCSLLETNGKLSVIEGEYEPDAYLAAVRGLEGEIEGGSRCTVCLGMRIGETARLASLGDYDYFATTLTVSPHKNAPLINTLGEKYSEEFGVKWLPSDFKKKNGYLRSIETCREYGIYRQNYCGCLFAKGDDRI